MLGISIYFQDFDLEYLKKAKQLGAKYIFTSLHIPEEDYSDLDEKLEQLLKFCNDNDIFLVPDISPNTFKKLGVKENDYKTLKKMGFKALRLDFGFDDYNFIKLLQEDFYLMLNASTADTKYLNDLEKHGVKVDEVALFHNFYPHSNTGLELEYFKSKNDELKKFKCDIQAFVCGDDLKRFPLYEGLPTLEKHRSIHPFVAAVELIKKCGVSDIFIGDSKAKISTLKEISSYMKDKTMHIKCYLEKEYEYLYQQKINVRKDLSANIVRLSFPRKENIEIYHNVDRPKGSIVMENVLAKRYCGEVFITKKDLGFEARSNVIGYIHQEYIDLVDYIDDETTIIFEKAI